MNKEVYENFSKLLNERFASGAFTTEDSIRYTYFAALLSSTNLKPHNIVIEFPHPSIERAQIDTYIPRGTSNLEELIEFKYHRQNLSGQNSPRPQQAGSLFKDIYRLLHFKKGEMVQRTLIYVTDKEMSDYMNNKNNGLHDFFQLQEGERLQINKDYINSKSDTFQKSVGCDFETTIECECSRSLTANHFLRIYTVL